MGVKNVLVLVMILISCIRVEAQVEKEKELPTVTIGIGSLTFDGDIGNGISVSSLSKIKAGYNLSIEQRIGNYIGVSLNGMYGKLADNENSATRNLNFQSKIIQGDLNLLFHFDNGLMLKRENEFAPYLSVGIGFLKFDPYGDLKDKSGIPYVYWKDGTIHDVAQSDPNAPYAVTLQRDYTYETQLKDSITNYKRHAAAIPIGVGFKFKITPKIGFNVGATYYFTMTDWIDNYKSGTNDKYLYANISLSYNFNKKSDGVYRSVDFSALENEDSDGDGVKDKIDLCPGTPKGVKVDKNGCPLDSDGDGVPDYLDKEPNTKKGAVVDANGVTVTDKELSQRQMLYDSAAVERSKMIYDYPSLNYLKQVESENKEKRKNNPGKIYTIPYTLRVADKNGDGYISPEEIIGSVEAFLEGDSDFTVEKINDLIDFFFEQ